MESLKLKIFIIKYYLSLSGSLQEYIYPCQAVYKNISFIGLDRKPIDQERTLKKVKMFWQINEHKFFEFN